ncbi:hypothetical protein IC619_005780 [Hazenella sp. IB182353]|nr:hypothetical protein [Polycladospora coralii]MBS7530006.1 hypothetical protein [Polycladospora coralii]
MNLNHKEWEQKMDNINWKEMLEDVEAALMDNLAAEIGFPTYDRLLQSSELISGRYHLTYLSDGRFAWWNPDTYATGEDPCFFSNKEEMVAYIASVIQLNQEQQEKLRFNLQSFQQMKRCETCDHEYNPKDPIRYEWDGDKDNQAYCSFECAVESVLKEEKDF